MAYLVVDKDGTEKIFQDEPDRDIDNWYIKETVLYTATDHVYLPTGSIKKLIGKTLTWEDDPVEI